MIPACGPLVNVMTVFLSVLDSKVHEAYMGPTWGQQDQGELHVGPMNLGIRGRIPYTSKMAFLHWNGPQMQILVATCQ